MAFGDWAPGSTLRPIRSIVFFDAVSGQVTSAVLEGEVYSPLGTFLKLQQFPWIPRSAEDAASVQTIGSQGFADIMTAEGLGLFGTPPTPPPAPDPPPEPPPPPGP